MERLGYRPTMPIESIPLRTQIVGEPGAIQASVPARGTNVLHLIPWLRQGGAEAMLAGLVHIGIPGVSHRIHTMMPAEDFFGIDPKIITSGSGRRGQPSLRLVAETRQAIGRLRPDIVHAWMYHANLASCFGIGQGQRTIWSIHNDGLTPANSKRSTRWVSATCARLSSLIPDRIVYVSQTVRDAHEADGYSKQPGIVIANGLDLQRFALAPAGTRTTIAGGRVKVLLAGRYDPIKGHHLLLDAVATHPERDRIDLVFAGRDCDTSVPLNAHIDRAGLRARCTVMPAVKAIETLYASADIVVLPSYAEAFPLTVLEAAACGRVICASRVGELAQLGLEPRFMFEPGDVSSCARALTAAIGEVDNDSGAGTRNRQIAERFGIEAAANAYLRIYAEVTGRNVPASQPT